MSAVLEDRVALCSLQPGLSPDVMGAFRTRPPHWITDHGYRLECSTPETLIYTRESSPVLRRLLPWADGRGVQRLQVRFDPAPDLSTRVTVTGDAPEDARAALTAWAAS